MAKRKTERTERRTVAERRMVAEVMSTPAYMCRLGDSLNGAAELMWEHDVGAIPVVDEDGRIAGIVTDRDVAMAAYTQGRSLTAIDCLTAMSRAVFTCRADDSLAAAERLMSDRQVRRLPVINADDRPIGIISLADIACAIDRGEGEPVVRGRDDRNVVHTFAEICRPQVPVD